LEETYKEVSKWLEHEQPTQSKQQKLATADIMTLLTVTAEITEKPEQPQILSMIRESRLFNVPFWDAPLLQWPYILKAEANECYRAEHDYQERVAFNLNQRAKILEKNINNNG
jgi:hypothetical protein